MFKPRSVLPQIAVDNMKGASSPMPAFLRLRNVQQMPYQCSENSTASEIATVFESAITRVHALRRNGFDDIVLVFLDEVSGDVEKCCHNRLCISVQ